MFIYYNNKIIYDNGIILNIDENYLSSRFLVSQQKKWTLSDCLYMDTIIFCMTMLSTHTYF